MAQDQDREKLHSDDDKERLHPKVEEYPKHRNAGEFGTHGGPNKPGKEDKRQIHAPGVSKAGSQ